MEKERIQFPKNQQKKFIKDAKLLSKTSWRKLGEFFNMPYNTIRTYLNEITRISFKDFEKICKKLLLDQKTVLKKHNAKKVEWTPVDSLKDAVFVGYKRTILKPVRIKYSEKNLELDTTNVDFSGYDVKRNIILPEKITPELAEEIGMHLGDGFLSAKRYEYRLKGNKNNEQEYYKVNVKPIFKKLYNINLPLKEYTKSYGFELRSKGIWEFKTKILNITTGKKENIRVPEKLKVNDTEILCSLLRGYFDTDGSIFFKSQNKNQSYYPHVSIVSVSKKLIKDTYDILVMLGFNPKLYKDSNKLIIMLYGYENFSRYLKIIGTKQPKNIKKIEEWKKRNPKIADRVYPKGGFIEQNSLAS